MQARKAMLEIGLFKSIYPLHILSTDLIKTEKQVILLCLRNVHDALTSSSNAFVGTLSRIGDCLFSYSASMSRPGSCGQFAPLELAFMTCFS